MVGFGWENREMERLWVGRGKVGIRRQGVGRVRMGGVGSEGGEGGETHGLDPVLPSTITLPCPPFSGASKICVV